MDNKIVNIENIYNNAHISEIDTFIKNTINTKIRNKNYVSASESISGSIIKLMVEMINISNYQLNDCKENKQESIIKLVRYADTSNIILDSINESIKKYKDKTLLFNILKNRHINSHIIEDKKNDILDSIKMNYNKNTSIYTLLFNKVEYNTGPCNFILRTNNKARYAKRCVNKPVCSYIQCDYYHDPCLTGSKEKMRNIVPSYVINLLNNLCDNTIYKDTEIRDLFQIGGALILKAMELKKNSNRPSNHHI